MTKNKHSPSSLINNISKYADLVQNPEQFLNALEVYAALVEQTRDTHNFIGRNEQVEAHIVDSIAALPLFIQEASSVPQCSLADLGTGAGFPGIPLALGFAAHGYTSNWYLVERSHTKVAFLHKTVHALQKYLTNTTIEIIPYNLREWSPPLLHIVTARAFRPLATIQKELKRVSGHATLLLYKGKETQIHSEFSSLQKELSDTAVFEIIKLNHEPTKERHIVKFRWI